MKERQISPEKPVNGQKQNSEAAPEKELLAVYRKQWYGFSFFVECTNIIWVDEFIICQDDKKQPLGVLRKSDFKFAIKVK